MKYIKYEEREHLGILTISRPKALNALNSEVLEELDGVLCHVNTDEIRCLLVTGEGTRAFAAGADIREMQEFSPQQAEKFAQRGNQIFRKIETYPLPVIAAVNGFALGGGCELALSCDIRICSENAVFGQPETGLGITPGFGGTQRLPRLISMSAAKQLLYTGQNINAREALRIGLVSAVYPIQQLMQEAERIAAEIIKNAPVAVRNCKKAVNEGINRDMEDAVSIETRLFGNCFTDQEQRKRMTAFLEKKK